MTVGAGGFRLFVSFLSLASAGALFALIAESSFSFDIKELDFKQRLDKKEFRNTLFYQIQTGHEGQKNDIAVASLKTLYNEGIGDNKSKSIVTFGVIANGGASVMLSDVIDAPDACFSEADINIRDTVTYIRPIIAGDIQQNVWMFQPKVKTFHGKKFHLLEIEPNSSINIISCVIDDIWEASSFSRRRMHLNYLLPGDRITLNNSGSFDIIQYNGLWLTNPQHSLSPVKKVEWQFDVRDGEDYQFEGGALIEDQDNNQSRSMLPSSNMSVEWENARNKDIKELIWILIGSLIAIGLTMFGAALRIFSANRVASRR